MFKNNNNSRYRKTNNISNGSYTIQSKNDFNPFDKNHWGPKTWEIMHIFSYNYPNNPDLTQKQNAFNFFSSIGWMLPCQYCQSHCIQYVRENPPSINSRNELINWVLQFHNTVNTRLGKNTWTRIRLDNKYETDNAFCA